MDLGSAIGCLLFWQIRETDVIVTIGGFCDFTELGDQQPYSMTVAAGYRR